MVYKIPKAKIDKLFPHLTEKEKKEIVKNIVEEETVREILKRGIK